MAETAITPAVVSRNTAFVLTPGAGTAINDANTMAIPYPVDGKLLIVIDSDHASTAATFAVGHGVAAGQGTLTVAVGDTVESAVIIDTDRFKQADGDVIISWATNSAGFLRAFYLPK